MILSNVAIQEALDLGRLRIEPEPLPRTPTLEQPNSPYDTTAVDLCLGPTLSIPNEGPFTYDLGNGQPLAKFLADNSKRVEIGSGGYALKPDFFILGSTLEIIGLPILEDHPPLAARIEGKSSFARCGLLVHFTAPTVHASFNGRLTLEMKNLGRNPITLYSGMPICQLILEEVSGTPSPNPSQFQGQMTPPGTV